MHFTVLRSKQDLHLFPFDAADFKEVNSYLGSIKSDFSVGVLEGVSDSPLVPSFFTRVFGLHIYKYQGTAKEFLIQHLQEPQQEGGDV
jgi:hypothetical protein